MSNQQLEPTIRFASFTDKNREAEFFRSYLNEAGIFLRPMLVLSAVLFVGMGIMDIIHLDRFVWFVLPIRILISLGSLSMSMFLKRFRSITCFSASMLVLGVSFSALTLYTASHYVVELDPLHLVIGLIVLLLIQFFIHVSWLFANLSAVLSTLLFVLLCAPAFQNATRLTLIFSAFYVIFFLNTFSMLAYAFSTIRHREFTDQRRLSRLSVTDPLTGLYNRAHIDEILQGLPVLLQEHGMVSCLVLFDLDGFKHVNDHYGHITGDRVLVSTTELVQQIIRRRDIFCRWGGEEFMLLLPDTRLQDAVLLAERIRLQLSEADFGLDEPVTASFGVAGLQPIDDAASFILRTDALMYKAKEKGKNRVETDPCDLNPSAQTKEHQPVSLHSMVP